MIEDDDEELQPLSTILPKDPEDMMFDELLERFRDLAVRCFNVENRLDMSKELNRNYEIEIAEKNRIISERKY